jgi:hypothetical protein
MRATRLFLAGSIVFGLVVVALAQEGYPLKGSWLGDFGASRTNRTPVFMTMDWDGKAISGMINPGTDNIPIKNATLTPPTPAPPRQGGGGGAQGGGGGQGGGGRRGQGGGGGGGQAAANPPAAAPAATPAPPPVPAGPVQPDWLVHFEADAKDRAGNAVHYVVDGKIESIGIANRSIVGTWKVGTTQNDFKIVRQ